MFTNFVCLPIHDFHPSVSSSVIFNSECLKMYFEQSWIFKSFSGMDADAGIHANHKIAIFK